MARQTGAVFGSRLHRVLQILKSRPDPGWVGETNPELQPVIDFVWNQDEPALREIIASGEVEWGFRAKSGDQVIHGRIDLWGKDSAGRLWVVDYKSGRVRNESAKWEQLKIYAWALRQFGHQEPIRMALVHPVENKVLVEEYRY